MKHSLIIRFGIAAVLISAGCTFFLAGISRGGIFFGLATIFFMPRSELTQPVPRLDLWLTFGVLFALIAASIAARYFLPGSAANVAWRVICHPAIVVPMWLLMLWGLYHHYQRQKRGVDA